MAEAAILTAAKTALRVTGTTIYDTEITDLLEAAELIMTNSGIDATRAADDTEPLIKMAKLVYVKAYFGWNNPDKDFFKAEFFDILSQMHIVGYEEAEA